MLRQANGFCNERSHSTKMLLPSLLYGKFSLTIGMRAVSLTVSTSTMPASVNFSANCVMAETPFSLVKSVAD